MSPTDRRDGLKIPDALAVIIPRGGHEPDTDTWGWFVYDGGDYRELDHAERSRRITLTDGPTEFAVVRRAEEAA